MTIEKLRMYKTAFSPLHNEFVKIVRVRVDNRGEALVYTKLIDGNHYMFMQSQLTDYCL